MKNIIVTLTLAVLFIAIMTDSNVSSTSNFYNSDSTYDSGRSKEEVNATSVEPLEFRKEPHKTDSIYIIEQGAPPEGNDKIDSLKRTDLPPCKGDVVIPPKGN